MSDEIRPSDQNETRDDLAYHTTTSCSSPAIAENVDQHDTPNYDSTPLHPTIAQRFVLLDTNTAEQAQQAVASHGKDWYTKSGLFDDRGDVQSSHNPARDRTLSDPVWKAQTGYGASEEGGNMPVVEEVMSADDVGPCEHLQSCKEDIGTVSSVFGSMLAEDDRGRI